MVMAQIYALPVNAILLNHHAGVNDLRAVVFYLFTSTQEPHNRPRDAGHERKRENSMAFSRGKIMRFHHGNHSSRQEAFISFLSIACLSRAFVPRRGQMWSNKHFFFQEVIVRCGLCELQFRRKYIIQSDNNSSAIL